MYDSIDSHKMITYKARIFNLQQTKATGLALPLESAELSEVAPSRGHLCGFIHRSMLSRAPQHICIGIPRVGRV